MDQLGSRQSPAAKENSREVRKVREVLKALPVSWRLEFEQVSPFTDLTDYTDFHRLIN